MTRKKIYYEVFYETNCNFLYFIQSIVEVSNYSARNTKNGDFVEDEELIEKARKLLDYNTFENFDQSHFIYKIINQNSEILKKLNIKYFRIKAVNNCDYIFNSWDEFKINVVPNITRLESSKSSLNYKNVSTSLEDIIKEANFEKLENELSNDYKNMKLDRKKIIEAQNFISNNKIKLPF